MRSLCLLALVLLVPLASSSADATFTMAGSGQSQSFTLDLPKGGDVAIAVHYRGASFAAGLHLHGPKGCTALDTTAGGVGPDTTIGWVQCRGLPAGPTRFDLSVDAGVMLGSLHASSGSW
jgi:hypothetical protein